jgi:hypothetical protein
VLRSRQLHQGHRILALNFFLLSRGKSDSLGKLHASLAGSVLWPATQAASHRGAGHCLHQPARCSGNARRPAAVHTLAGAHPCFPAFCLVIYGLPSCTAIKQILSLHPLPPAMMFSSCQLLVRHKRIACLLSCSSSIPCMFGVWPQCVPHN